MKKKFVALLIGVALMVNGAASAATEKEYIQNGDFDILSYDMPLHWELYNGAKLEIPYREPAEGEKETVLNGSVEILTDRAPDGWKAYYAPWNGSYVQAKAEAARTGNVGIKFNGVTGANMTAGYTINQVTPGATYQYSGWGKIMSEGGAGQVKIALYDANDTCLLSRYVSLSQSKGTNVWQQVYDTVEIPQDCTYAVISCAVKQVGTVYFDDLSFYMTEPPHVFSMMTEDIFHYAERGVGKVHVNLDPYYQRAVTAPKVDFSIADENGKTILSQTGVFFKSGEAVWEYSVKSFAMRKPYTLTAKVRSNFPSETFTEEIYKYPRPTALGADGTYYDENGDPFVPVIAYHPGDYTRLSEIGINVAEILAGNAKDTLAKLDKLEALGLKALVSLFGGPAYMMPAGHPENLATTIEVVSAIKNHPAVFAYAVQDEPFGGANEQIELWLREAYRVIRTIDERHPIYIVENAVDCYDLAGRMADVLAVDPYPYQAYSGRVTTSVRKAQEAVYGRKPIYAILQTFQGSAFFPTADNVREQVYRALEEGARGIGYYTIEKAIGQWGGLPAQNLYDIEDRWTPMKQYAEKEMPEILDHFTLGKYPVLCKLDDANDGIYYEAWAKGEKEIYLVVHNRSESERTAAVMLESSNKAVKVNGFTAEAISLGLATETVSGSALTVTLEPNQAIFYKIIPNKAIDMTRLQSVTLQTQEETTSAGRARITLQAAEDGAVIMLPVQNARTVHYVYGLEPEHSYAVSIIYKGSVSNSAKLEAEYRVKNEQGILSWTKWSKDNNAVCIDAQEKYTETFGKANMTYWETVTFHLTVPRNANAVKLNILAVKADPELKIGAVSMKDTDHNLVANGDCAYKKDEKLLTGNWTAYMDYPAQVGNVAELRQEGDRSFLYMTEAPPGKEGRSANARQIVYLYTDTIYKLSFLYKDMGNAPEPIICLNNMSGGGHTVEDWPAPIQDTNGWARYSVCFRPNATGAHTLWLGSQNAKGAYAYTEVSLVPIDNLFFTERETTVKGAGSATVFDAISAVSEAVTSGTEKVVYVRLPEKENVRIATYYGEDIPELLKLIVPETTPFARITVPTGGMIRVFVWQTGTMLPLLSAATLK